MILSLSKMRALALVAVMAVEAVEPDHCLGDGPLGVGGFGVVIVVVEVVGDLGGEGTTLLTYSPSSFLSWKRGTFYSSSSLRYLGTY